MKQRTCAAHRHGPVHGTLCARVAPALSKIWAMYRLPVLMEMLSAVSVNWAGSVVGCHHTAVRKEGSKQQPRHVGVTYVALCFQIRAVVAQVLHNVGVIQLRGPLQRHLVPKPHLQVKWRQ